MPAQAGLLEPYAQRFHDALRREAMANESMHGPGSVPPLKTVYGSVSVPAISLPCYMQRIVQFTPVSEKTWLMCTVYLERLLERTHKLVLHKSCHRLLAALTLVAVKFDDDNFNNNAYMATVYGVPAKEVNRLEIATLQTLEWRLYISEREYEEAPGRLLALSNGHSYCSGYSEI